MMSQHSRLFLLIFALGFVVTGDQPQADEPDLAHQKADGGSVVTVGPSRFYKTPSAAAMIANDGAIVEIDAAVYQGDVAVWPQSDLILRGVGGRPHLTAEGNSAEGKAIWVIKGSNVTIENFEFSGARVSDMNGAAIRHEGGDLAIKNIHAHDNQIGILAGGNPKSEIKIEKSEFNNNATPGREIDPGHNIYIGDVGRFTLLASYVHDAETGHNVKSRARENFILYNRIMDEDNASSYLVDISEGGSAYLIGNLFRQISSDENRTLVAFAPEGHEKRQQHHLYAVNNTFVNDDIDGIFLQNSSLIPAQVKNNIFLGAGSIVAGPAQLSHNLVNEDAGLRDRSAYDYRLSANSSAIDGGIKPGEAESGFSLVPKYQYVHPRSIESRSVDKQLDIGAYEYIDIDSAQSR